MSIYYIRYNRETKAIVGPQYTMVYLTSPAEALHLIESLKDCLTQMQTHRAETKKAPSSLDTDRVLRLLAGVLPGSNYDTAREILLREES